jgi:hypothetical protein
MRNSVFRSKHPERSGLYEITSNGSRVWVNGPKGESIARITQILHAGVVSIDVHKPIDEVCRTGEECLDCRNDLKGAQAWDHFVTSLQQNYGVRVSNKHRPSWAV